MNYNYKKINNTITPFLNLYNYHFQKKDYDSIINIDNFIRSRSNTLLYNYIHNPLFNITKKENEKNKLKLRLGLGNDLQFCLFKNNIEYSITPICCGLIYYTVINLDNIIIKEYYKLIEQHEKNNYKYPIYQPYQKSSPILMSRPKPTTTFRDYFNDN